MGTNYPLCSRKIVLLKPLKSKKRDKLQAIQNSSSGVSTESLLFTHSLHVTVYCLKLFLLAADTFPLFLNETELCGTDRDGVFTGN